MKEVGTDMSAICCEARRRPEAEGIGEEQGEGGHRD